MRIAIVHLLLIVLFSALAYAISGTSKIASEGNPVAKETAELNGWPDGVLELLNLPARTDGWNPWFSELPNDVHIYELRPNSSTEVNTILERLAAIHCEVKQVLLSPEREVRSVGYGKRFAEGEGAIATFSIGSQPRLEEWYERLRENDGGERVFGVQRYTECPTATPPTLTLYVGNPVIELDELRIPDDTEVGHAVSEQYREENADDPVLQAIDALLLNRTSSTS